MEYVARRDGRITDSVCLQIHPDILRVDGVMFTADVSNKSGVDIISLEDALAAIDFHVLYTRTSLPAGADAGADQEPVGLIGQERGADGLAALLSQAAAADRGVAADGLVAWRRKDLLALLEQMNQRIEPLDEAVEAAAEQNAEARLLKTHPGVGPVVSLAYVLIVGDWQRFPRGKQVGSYLGLIPAEASSGKHQQRMGHVTKQGNTLLRWLLVEAASKAQSKDPNWHRQYLRLSMTKHHGVAKVAIAHKLAVRLYWMLRSGQNYTQMMERGSHVGQSV